MTNTSMRHTVRRAKFLYRILQSRFRGQPTHCPFCGNNQTVLVERKKIVLDLRRCPNCFLRFRYPKEAEESNREYYQYDYIDKTPINVPAAEAIQRMKAERFKGEWPFDVRERLALLNEIKKGGSALDFGCNWGYGVWQLRDMGFDAVGFEISRPRAEAGRRYLGVEIISDVEKLVKENSGRFDVVFASHVFEHLPNLRQTLSVIRSVLKPDGVLLAYVPNADGEVARDLGVRWGPMIDEDHVLALDARFFARNLPMIGFKQVSCTSLPSKQPFRSISDSDAVYGMFPGPELVVLALNN